MPTSVTLPPNWRPLPTAGGSEPTVFRSAALSLATVEELSTCPSELTWFDLRIPAEVELDPQVEYPPTLRHRNTPLLDPEVTIIQGQKASMLQDLIDGTTTFGSGYIDMLEAAPERFAATLEALATVDGPVVIACQGGRDRSGLVSALLLSLAGTPREAVIADYVATNANLASDLARQPTGDMGDIMAQLDLTCRESDIEMVLEHLDSRGGIRGYLAPVLSEDRIDRLQVWARERLS